VQLPQDEGQAAMPTVRKSEMIIDLVGNVYLFDEHHASFPAGWVNLASGIIMVQRAPFWAIIACHCFNAFYISCQSKLSQTWQLDTLRAISCHWGCPIHSRKQRIKYEAKNKVCWLLVVFYFFLAIVLSAICAKNKNIK
jgi:hypothetical protein